MALASTDFGLQANWIHSTSATSIWLRGMGDVPGSSNSTKKSPVAALIQLRSRFRTHQRYSGIYERDELIAHELAHVGRMMFEEPVFEELLAYRTAKSPLRRWLGPLISSSKETLLFVVVIGAIFALDLFAFVSQQPALYHQLLWAKLIPFS